MENKKSVGLETGCKPYMAGLQLPLLIAVVAAVISSIITVYGPTKIKEITNLISDGLVIGIDLEAVSSIAGFLVVLYVFGAILNYTQAYIFQRVSNIFQNACGQQSLKKSIVCHLAILTVIHKEIPFRA